MKRKLLFVFLLLTLIFSVSVMSSGCNGCGSKSYKIIVVCSPEEGGTITGDGIYKKDSTYILKATPNANFEFDGWYIGDSKLSGETTFSGIMGSFDMQITAKFNDVNRTLTIYYKDDLGNKLLENNVVTKKKGESYNIAVENLVGYTADKTFVSGVLNSDTSVTVTYTRKSYKLQVNYVNESNNVLGKVENNFRYGDNYSYQLKGKVDYYESAEEQISGKIHQSNNAVNSQLNKSTIVINAKFIAKSYTINFILKDFDGNVFTNAKMESVTKKYKESYSFSPINIIGYNKESAISGALTLTDSVFGQQLVDKTKNELNVVFKYTLKDYNFTLNYVDEENCILGSEQKTYKFGDTYEFVLQDKVDYYTPELNSVQGVINADNSELVDQLNNSDLTLSATFIPYTYTINFLFVDESENPILDAKMDSITKKYKESYSIELLNITGYNIKEYTDKTTLTGTLTLTDSLFGQQLADKTKKELSVIFKYAQKNYDLKVNYVDENNEVLGGEQKSYKFGDSYEFDLQNKVDYYRSELTKIQGIINTSNQELVGQLDNSVLELNVLFYPETYTINFNLIDEDGAVIPDAVMQPESKKYMETYSFTPITINGWVCGTQVAEGSLTLEDAFFGEQLTNKQDELTITFVYISLTKPREIAVKYVNANNVEIKTATTISEKVGNNCEVDIPEIEDYVTDTAKLSEIYGENYNSSTNKVNVTILSDEDFCITLYYKIKTANLTIKYLKVKDGSAIKSQYSKTLDYYSSYSVDSPTVKGYTADKTIVSGTIQNSDVDITVYYTAKKFKVTVNYYYKDTTTKVFNSSETTVDFDSTFTLTSPEKEGYKPDIETVNFVLNEESDKTINVYYTIQSYLLTVKYVSSVEGFVCPASITETIRYNEQYSYASPTYYGLSVDKATVAGNKKAYNEEITVTYSNKVCLVYFNYFYNETKIGGNSLQISFNTKSASVSVPNVIVCNNLGYKINYKSFEASIIYQNNDTTIKVYGVNGSKTDLTATLTDKIKTNGYAECSVTAEKVNSTVTFKYVDDANNVLATESFTKQYGETISIDRKSFGEGYVIDYTDTTYKFTEENKTVFLKYNRIERTVTVFYLDDTGKEISSSVKKTYKYNEKFNIISPIFDCYSANKTNIDGTMQLTNLTYYVTYSVQWDLDENGALIIANTDDLVKLSKYSVLWGRDISFTDNLDLNGISINPIGNNEVVFSGNIIGNNKTIKNLNITDSNVIKKTVTVNSETVIYAYAGLFGCLSGSVSDLTIQNATINVNLGTSSNSTIYSGLLCGLYSGSGTVTIDNVQVSGTISVGAKNCVAGGMIGFNSGVNGEIKNCTCNITINNSGCEYAQIGGISGYEVASNIHNCSVTITTTFVSGEKVFVGGITGESVNGAIYTNTCNVSTICGKQNSTILY